MNTPIAVKVCFIGLALAGCAAIATDTVSDITGQFENGSETFTGQIVGADMTIRTSRGRVCQGSPAPNPVILTCSDGTAGTLDLRAQGLSIGGTGSGTIGDQNVVLNFGPFECNGICRWAKIPGL